MHCVDEVMTGYSDLHPKPIFR